ncbi:MAG: methyltransferase [Pseudomonadota bacterium]
MADLAPPQRSRARLTGWPTRLIASRGFQRWAAQFPLTRRLVRREGEALFDLLAGFCHSQVLMALVQFDIPGRLMNGPQTPQQLAFACAVPEDRMAVLLRAAMALKLLKRTRGGRVKLSQKGAALVGVPGLSEMILHHDVLYRDLADPAAFFRGEVETELAGFWPYVFGGEMPDEQAAIYSDLMAQSQVLVAEDTLRVLGLKGVSHLMDVGGGTGTFLAAVGAAYPGMRLTLFDLPQVVDPARARFACNGMSDRAEIVPGSFRRDSLPTGADAISLVRVLYDHSDETVCSLLAKCHAALPPGGQLIISEPMTGGNAPAKAGDVYFALYTMAMRTGKARSREEIAALCEQAGFDVVATPRPARPFVTSCLKVRKR